MLPPDFDSRRLARDLDALTAELAEFGPQDRPRAALEKAARLIQSRAYELAELDLPARTAVLLELSMEITTIAKTLPPAPPSSMA
ncbi:hypothetical protein SAMN04488047_101260 [Tranquillimonas alkanivorans]|uniref:Uncharacterized protein n=2 Tax=Tranquillimonas alkanivorans TaxID=441119 RepID=A0A1I5KQ89_9RHOB|nr:hypothetical protein SAMN04488047_101260 [Tranquillimonas alkanivorans]